jgi:hypothetical protein
MVAIIPNRAELEGKIVSIKKERGRDDFHNLKLQLIGVTLLKGADTLSDLEAGQDVNLLVTTEAVKSNKIKKGLVISCLIRRAAGEDYFIIPDSIRIISGDPDKSVDR